MSTSTDIYLWQSYNSVFAVQFLTFFFVLLLFGFWPHIKNQALMSRKFIIPFGNIECACGLILDVFRLLILRLDFQFFNSSVLYSVSGP